MKKLAIIFYLYLIVCNSYGQFVFNRNYYVNGNLTLGTSRANTVIQCSDGGFLMAGTSDNASVSSVIKTNDEGDTLWHLNFDFGATNYGHQLQTAIEISDGNYVVGGTSGDPVAHQSQADLIKINKNNGDTLWVKKIRPFNLSERCYKIKQTADGGFAFCGIRYTNTSGTSSDATLVKTDSMGNVQWERTYGGANYDFGFSLEFTSEGGYMILGTTYSYGLGPYNMYLVKTDSLGNIIWQKTYGNNFESYGNSIVKTTDGNYVLVGGDYVSSDSLTAYVVKIDTAGIIQWQKRYRGLARETEFTGVKQLSTGEIMVCGDDQGDTLNNSYYGILKKLNNNDGSMVWNKNYHYFNTDSTQHYFYAMDICNDGGLVMAGMTIDAHHTVTSPRNGMWLVKTDCMGNDSIWDSVACPLNVGIAEQPKEISSMLVYPNPTSGLFTVRLNDYMNKESRIKISNLLGEIVYEMKMMNSLSQIDISKQPSGIYFVSVIGAELIVNQKIIKE